MESLFQDGQGLLTVIVSLPAALAFLLAAFGFASHTAGLPLLPASAWRASAFVVTSLTFLVALYVAVFRFDPERLGLQLLESMAWAPGLGLSLSFGIDGIGLCFLLVTTGIVPLSLLATRTDTGGSAESRIFATLAIESALIGTLLAANLMLFVLFWALSLLPVLLWLGRFGGEGRERAASRIWTVESISLAGLLFVILVLHEASVAQLGAPTLDLAGARGEGAPLGLLDIRLEFEQQRLLFIAFGVALATRLPIVPMHFWLPAAHAAAPIGLSVLIATGFVQTAALGALRFALPLFPDAAASAGPALSILGIVALAYASLIALVQKELRRLLAYSSVGYAGFALFGISTLNVQGLSGAVLQVVTHGLATAGLLTLTGFLAVRRGTTEVAAFGGLAKPMPVCAFFFGLMVLSLMGLPLLGGFVGDLFVLLGSLETRRTLSVMALLAMVIAASYLLWVQRRIFLGPVDEPANRGLIDLDRRERLILLMITIPIIGIGVYPNPVLRRIEPAVLELLYQMERRSVVIPDIEGAEGDASELAAVPPMSLEEHQIGGKTYGNRLDRDAALVGRSSR